MRRGTRQVVIGGVTRYLDLVGKYDREGAERAAQRLRATHFVRVFRLNIVDYGVYALLDEGREIVMLRSGINRPAVERAIRREARSSLLIPARELQTDYEHGQWWVTDRKTGAQWSVVDCAGMSGDYFGFEQVTRGDQE